MQNWDTPLHNSSMKAHYRRLKAKGLTELSRDSDGNIILTTETYGIDGEVAAPDIRIIKPGEPEEQIQTVTAEIENMQSLLDDHLALQADINELDNE